MAEVAGHVRYVIARALAYAIDAIERLPDNRRELGDQGDMKRLLAKLVEGDPELERLTRIHSDLENPMPVLAEETMTVFRVRCYNRGVWDQAYPREIEAKNELEAAQSVCGQPLVEAGQLDQLRAEVWPAGSPTVKRPFYVPAEAMLD